MGNVLNNSGELLVTEQKWNHTRGKIRVEEYKGVNRPSGVEY